MPLDHQMLPERTINEIARLHGQGRLSDAQKINPAKDCFGQLSRLKNYEVAIERAAPFVRDRNGMDKRRRDAIWRHVCAEVDLMLHDAADVEPRLDLEVGYEITGEMVIAYAAAVGEAGGSVMTFQQFLNQSAKPMAVQHG
jgi:hypothetical protein